MGKLKKESKTIENLKEKKAKKIDGSIKKSKKNKDKLKKKLKEAPVAIVQGNLNVDSNGKEKSTTKKDKAIKKSLGKKIEKKQLKKSKNNVENKNSPTKTGKPTCESKAKPSHVPGTQEKTQTRKELKKQRQKEKAAKRKENKKLELNSTGQTPNASAQAKKDTDPALVLFVGNVPPETQPKHMRAVFKDFSPIRSVRFRESGGNKLQSYKKNKDTKALKNAYVVFKDAETAEKALSLNGIEFKGQTLRVMKDTIKIKRQFKGNLGHETKKNANESKKKNEFHGARVPGIKKWKSKKQKPNKMIKLPKMISTK